MSEESIRTAREWSIGNRFRELKPVELWGGNIALEQVEKHQFQDTIRAVVQEQGRKCFGYFVEGDSGLLTYHISRYPRRKLGALLETDSLRQLMETIGERGGFRTHEESATQGDPYFRVVLGLEEGYAIGTVSSLEQVRAFLGEGYKLTSADFFVVFPGEGRALTYQEKAVLIEGDLWQLEKVYKLAEALKQERFAVEIRPERSAKLVETNLCGHPDAE